jgi:hypothetical protein
VQQYSLKYKSGRVDTETEATTDSFLTECK